MTLEDLASRCQKAKKHGKGFTACCPAHEDSNPSLSINPANNGGIVLHCHAGCSPDQVCAALGLTLADLMPEAATNGNGKHDSYGYENREIVATYDYTDEDGEPLFRVVRRANKEFFQERWEGGRWLSGLADTRRVLFRLPAVLEAVANQRPVYICEGEKDVLTLERLGFTATTNPMGAGVGKWRDEYSVWLDQASVYVLPDNDKPGREHAEAVLRSLNGHAKSAKILPVPAQHKDVSDWIAAGATALDFMPTRLPRAIPASQLTVKPIAWLADGLLLDGEYTMIAAPGGTYKSTLMLAIAAAVANGAPVLGAYPMVRPRSVLVVSEEDPGDVIRNRLDALVRGHDFDPSSLDHIHVIALEGARVTDPEWQQHIQDEAERTNAGLICLDPLADLLDGDKAEKDNEAARPVVQWLRRLTKAGRATLVIHHYSKTSDSRQGQERVRGAGAWANGARAIYSIEDKDNSLWLGCDKISRVPRQKEPKELRLDIQSEPGNQAMWVSARIELAHQTPAWGLDNPERLTPSERSALHALERHQAEWLSWSKWCSVSDLSQATISRAIKKLQKMDYIEAKVTGQHAGKDSMGYRITGAGIAACLT